MTPGSACLPRNLRPPVLGKVPKPKKLFSYLASRAVNNGSPYKPVCFACFFISSRCTLILSRGYFGTLITEQEFRVNPTLVLLSNKLILRYSNVGENTLLTSGRHRSS